MEHFFSVITSVYNGEKYIQKAIESVVCQTEKDFEYIIVDNGSTDSTSDIIKELQNATLYLHPSHIENSANSICEAQYIGTPTIATNVGGTSSILSNDAGILVSPNDPYEIVSAILKIWNDKDFALKLSRNEILTAEKRHDKIIIKKQTINAYKTIINEVINHNNQQK